MAFDYVLAASAAVITASAIVLGGFLSNYRTLVKEAEKSNRLAKDVWDSANSRFSVIDSRMIDLMARTEVLSERMGLAKSFSERSSAAPASVTPSKSSATSRAPEQTRVSAPIPATAIEGTETELRVLRLLATGPRSSAQIKDSVGRSREHTARMMKELFERGLVVRNDRNKPYVYELTDAGRSYVAS